MKSSIRTACFAALLSCGAAQASYVTVVDDAAIDRGEDGWWEVLPYVFYTSGMEWFAGVGGGMSGYGQPNLNLVGTALVSTNDSALGFVYMSDLQMPRANRLFVDALIYSTRFTKDQLYIPTTGRGPNPAGNPGSPGSNDSDVDDYVFAHTEGQEYRLYLNYLLPIGDGAGANPVHTYHTRNGVVVPGSESGGREWNPLTSGRSFLKLEPYFWEQNVQDQSDYTYDEPERSVGLRFELMYDNRDYRSNPTRGSYQKFTVNRDWGDSKRPEWYTWEFEASKYVALGENKWAHQQVLAFNFWTIDTPTWNDTSVVGGQSTYQRPAWFAGARLGGWKRMRGYQTNRFYDRSAIYYSGEYRFTPKWNPMPLIPFVRRFNIPAWHWVAFGELGRVADDYDLSELHKDMKYSVGASVRVMLEGLVLQGSYAVSDQDSKVYVGVNHPF
ncbi:hypothetical protein DBZ36_02325 [Alginatibacterium sediminis]|uniref:Bacterial surface antigen (D15) domain-containing protein n=1 Tax=Alginatibacterium sediminis TaxID=2164068 RepID=A0A420ELD3_9ALTE|nr:BamA/TamA family outer membrane protein [Alginatibacterium sediminis]RKF21505.1 hypothetical protein DBZ36_02325 [Alginatibacterium sediminis]